MRMATLSLGLVLAAGSSSMASAATVKVSKNDVFIDRGSGYVKVSGSTSGQAGHVVMAMNGGSAVIIYDDGCQQKVNVGAVGVIGEASPCASGDASGVSTETLLIGGAAVAVGAGLIIALSDDDDPASDEAPAPAPN